MHWPRKIVLTPAKASETARKTVHQGPDGVSQLGRQNELTSDTEEEWGLMGKELSPRVREGRVVFLHWPLRILAAGRGRPDVTRGAGG